MLVLTRRVGEEIVIDGAIRVTVVALKGENVRLGVTAPASVRVDRKEVHERLPASGSRDPSLAAGVASQESSSMQKVQQGDRVQVHYVKRFQDGTVASTRHRAPLALTVGVDHPSLPGLGLALVGLARGARTTVKVPTERAYGAPDSARVRRLARARFPKDQPLPIGKWVRLLNRRGRRRLVRVLEVHADKVVVDANHRWAGQAMEVEVRLIAINAPATGPDLREP